MHRLAFVVLVGCASSPPVEPVAPVAPPTSHPRFVATIGERPFVPRTALMTQVNHHAKGSGADSDGNHYELEFTVSEIRIYERAATCADLVGSYFRELPLGVDERSVGIRLIGEWPVRSGTVLPTDEHDPRIEHAEVELSEGYKPMSSTGAFGTVKLTRATRNAGTVWLDVATDNAHSRRSGSLRGEIRFTVCRDPSGDDN
jgi:hypothetical protein